MNIDQFKQAIALCHEAKVSIFGWGPKGLGKSTAPKAYAKSRFHFDEGTDKQKVQFGVKVLHAAQIEGSDLRGLPMADPENNRTKFLPPEDLPQHEFIDEDGVTFGKPGDEIPNLHNGRRVALYRGVLVLDELNRAEDDVIQAIFQLITDYACGGYTLPTGWSIVAAGNPSGAKYRVNSMVNDAAFISRFSHLHIEVDETYRNGWLSYMHDLESDPRIAEAITQFCCFRDENLCEKDGETDELAIEPNPRAWEYVLRIENAYKKMASPDPKVRTAVINGLLGLAVGSAYMNFNAPVTPQQILDTGVTPQIDKILADRAVVTRSGIQAILHGLASKAGKIAAPNEKQIANVFSFGRWLIKHGDDYRDLATAFFSALTAPELKSSLKGAAMINDSIRVLLMAKKQAGVWYGALAKDTELYKYVMNISYGNSSGAR